MQDQVLKDLITQFKQSLEQLVSNLGLWPDYIMKELIPELDRIAVSLQSSNSKGWFAYFNPSGLYKSFFNNNNTETLTYLYEILTGKDKKFSINLFQDVETLRLKTQNHKTSYIEPQRFEKTIYACERYLQLVTELAKAIGISPQARTFGFVKIGYLYSRAVRF